MASRCVSDRNSISLIEGCLTSASLALLITVPTTMAKRRTPTAIFTTVATADDCGSDGAAWAKLRGGGGGGGGAGRSAGRSRPQKRQRIAASWICSAQKGQDFIANGMSRTQH